MIVDLVNGLPMPAGGVFFDGGANAVLASPPAQADPTPAADVGDALQVVGATTNPASIPASMPTAPGAAGSGVVAAVLGATPVGLITFTGVDSGNLTDAAVEISSVPVVATVLPGASDAVTLAAGRRVTTPSASPADALVVSGTSGGVAFTPLAVRNLTQFVLDTTLTAGAPSDGPADQVTVSNSTANHAVANVTINTGAGTVGTESVQVTGPLAVSGHITVSSQGLAFLGGTLTAGPAGTVTLSAGGGAITTSQAATDVVAQALVATAGTGIGSSTYPLQTTLSKLEATTTSGGVFVANTGESDHRHHRDDGGRLGRRRGHGPHHDRHADGQRTRYRVRPGDSDRRNGDRSEQPHDQRDGGRGGGSNDQRRGRSQSAGHQRGGHGLRRPGAGGPGGWQ